MKKRILIYTDCDFFAGCENMPVSIYNYFFDSEEIDVYYAYRYSERYDTELNSRAKIKDKLKAVKIFSLTGLFLGEGSLKKIGRITVFILRFLLLPVFFVHNYFVLGRVIKQGDYDLLLLNNGGYPGAFSVRCAAIFAGWVSSLRVVMVVNNIAEDSTKPMRLLGFFMDRMVRSAVHTFVTASEPAGLALERELSVSRDRRRVIFNGIDESRLLDGWRHDTVNDIRSNNELVFAIIGVLEPRKGHSVLLEAVSLIDQRKPNYLSGVGFVIEGGGPLKADLQKIIVERNLQKRVRMLGTVPDVASVYRAADALILPSVCHEDLPNVVSEALAFGLPVICSELAGTPSQVIHKVNGWLVPVGEAEALSLAIQECIERRKDLPSMGAAGRSLFEERFSLDKVIPAYKRLIEELTD